ncbi:MAG: D-glycerate dehydrogenase [Smithellaceae bacterium]|nr:D-glycerate dehydrogenase [Smithellaceae bacterium]
MKKKVFVSREIFEEAVEYLSSRFEVTANQEDKLFAPDELALALADKDGAVITLTERIDESLLSRCPKLKAVCNVAVGFNNIDLPACSARQVMATNTPGVLDDTTADFTWALILATARRITEAEAYIRAGQWKKWQLKQFLGLDVHHATLGIIGLGRIGQVVARRATGFDMRVIYHDIRRAVPEVEAACRCRYVSREELLAESDIVTIHVPYSPETHHFIGAADFARMKRTAIFINAARGGVADDAALVDALSRGVIAGAGLDVFEGEPKLHPGFLSLKNVVLAPHIASSSERTRSRMAMMAAENLVAALEGRTPPNILNPEVAESATCSGSPKGSEPVPGTKP